MSATAMDERYDAIYRARFEAGESGWHDAATAAEVHGLLLELLRRAGIAEGRALELGCGTGSLTRTLADAGFDVLGLDISPVAIGRARTASQAGTGLARRGSCVFEAHDITRPRSDLEGRFDLVLDGLVLHCITDKAARTRAVSLARRSLRPGGAMLVMSVCGEPRCLPPGSAFDPMTRCLTSRGIAEAYYATPAELEALFAAERLVPVYRKVFKDTASSGDPDLYIGVFRENSTKPQPDQRREPRWDSS